MYIRKLKGGEMITGPSSKATILAIYIDFSIEIAQIIF